jgi:hypothetical protein
MTFGTRKQLFCSLAAVVATVAAAGGLAGSGLLHVNSANQAQLRPQRPVLHVAGQHSQICQEPNYLTSPWTYHALARNSRRYTVSQYERLRGYGKTLPLLPTYIADEEPGTLAAVIMAPGATASAPAYEYPLSPVLYFFEGGAYGSFGFESAPGDLFIGGSAPAYNEPTFSGGGISSANDTWDFSGGGSTLASSEPAGSTTITTTAAISGYINEINFADGLSYKVNGSSGSTINLTSPLKELEPVGAAVWADRAGPLSHLATALAQGATTVQTGAANDPIVPWEHLDIGAGGGALDTVQVSAVSGTETGGYTLTLTQPVITAAGAGAPVYYGGAAGDVTVEYMNIGNGGGNTTIAVDNGAGLLASGWTIEHNDIHDNYAGGSDYASTNAGGIGIYGGDNSTIEYNCFQRLGDYAINAFGANVIFDHNQVDQTPYNPDLDGNGDTGCGKWWATTNADLVDNAFTDEGYSACVWFDNGNTGMLVQGNYFYDIASRAIQNETGYNSEYVGNLFEDVTAGIYLNDSGGWDIPGSNYNNEIVIQGNTFFNAQDAVDIWGASARSCLNSGEGAANGESDAYCSGGFPQMPPTEQYFSHYHDSTVGEAATVVGNQSCSSSSPCSTVTLSNALAIDDWAGFAGQGPDSSTSDPVATSSSGSTDVSTFTGSGTIAVSSTAGFASSGQLLLSTSAGTLPDSTGAVVSYTGTTSSSFTGVSLVSGSGTLSGTVDAVQPYHVTAVSCPGGNCTDNAVATVSPAITSNLTAGTDVYTTGTCPYYVTTTATPSSPMAPNGTSYYDGCMWEDRNISVTDNTFDVNPAQLEAAPEPVGATSAWTCTTGAGGNCGQNAMGYQYPGGNAEPYNDVTLSNAMMSDSSLSSPLANLNASGSPLATSSSGDVGANSAAPFDNLWSDNTYNGDWTFQAYSQAAGCPLNWAGNALVWVEYSGNACSGLSLAQWQTIWRQD